MSGIGMVLNTAKKAITAQQYSLNVTGHNVANVNNPFYTRQTIPHTASRPALYGGFLFGTGVETGQVTRTSDERLENQLIEKKSILSKYEVSVEYMEIMERLFDVSPDSSINSLLSEFWNTWQNLSDNPSAASERVGVYENGSLIAARFASLDEELVELDDKLTFEIEAVIDKINTLASDIAKLNGDIVKFEANKRTANDLRDMRNEIVTELAQIIDIKTFEQDQGDLTVTVAKGYVLVNIVDSYPLDYGGGEIRYQTPNGGSFDISDDITVGKIAGWLDIREDVVGLYNEELDILAKEFIWAVNLQHSQGAGLNYISSPITGTYATDTSRLLDTLTFGNKIDYAKEFAMWIEDTSAATTQYSKVEVDMSISGSGATSWAGVANGASNFKYVFTVTESGQAGLEINATETDGAGLGTVQSGADISTILTSAIAEQVITVTDSSSVTQTVDVKDLGGDADRSASSIASALNDLTGVTAYASDNVATIDISNILTTAAAEETQENDLVTFTLSSGGKTSSVSFRIGVNDTATLANFNDALKSGVADINGAGNDLSVSFSGNTATITSSGGENIGMENFDVEDMPVVTLDTFQNMGVTTEVTIDNFTNFQIGDSVRFTITTAQGSVETHYYVSDDTSQATMAADLQNILASGTTPADLLAIGVTTVLAGNGVTVTGDASAGFLDFQATASSVDYDESFDITAAVGTSQYPAPTGIDNALLFDDSFDTVQFAGDNQVTFQVNGTLPPITVDLRRVDTTVAANIATAFYNGLNGNVTNATVINQGTAVRLEATAEFTSFGFTSGTETVGVDGSFVVVSNQGGLVEADNIFTLDNVDTVTYNNIRLETDWISFDGATITESGGVGNDSGVKTGAATIFLDPGYTIQSSVDGTGVLGGLFNKGAAVVADLGDSIITLGGNGGFSGFDYGAAGDTISFSIDGNAVSYTVGINDDTDVEYATALFTQIDAALGAAYTVIRNDASITILKRDAVSPYTPAISITGFADDDGSVAGNSATLAVRTGAGIGSSYPATSTLSSSSTSATSLINGSEGKIVWEKLTSAGASTGASGTIDVDTDKYLGTYDLYPVDDGSVNPLRFDLSAGSLVSGNTFTINTDSTGAADLLNYTATGAANSVLDIYKFEVTSITSGGASATEGTIGADVITLGWSNSITSGTITIPATAAPVLPTENDGVLDGMTLLFSSGTLFTGDEFTITTDSIGTPTVNLPSQWHWTLDSFAGQFNRQAPGVSATVNNDNTLTFAATSTGLKFSDFSYVNSQYPAAGDPGFNSDNTTVKIDNYTALTRSGSNFRLQRSGGDWSVPTNLGYTVSITALDDLNLDNGFSVDLDGTRAFTVTFNTAVSNDGYMEFDIAQTNGNYKFAFSDDETQDSGLAAALGINTFFDGEDAMTIEVNDVLTDRNLIAAAQIDADSGEIGAGDNRNALDIADLQHVTSDIPYWSFTRGEDSISRSVSASLEGYYQTILGEMGVTAQSMTSNSAFSENMVIEFSRQRDSISAVSVDEEMINLIKYQSAFSVASKLLTVADEMLATLIASR